MPQDRIDRTSPVPYYAQVAQVLQEQIKSGDWRVGDRLPSEATLCEIFNVSRPVIRQALHELLTEGLIVRRKGQGSFVATPKIREGLFQRLGGFYQDMVNQGYAPVTRVLKQEIMPANRFVAGQLRIDAGTPVIEIERVRSVEYEPIVWVATFIPLALCPPLVSADLADKSLYTVLEEEFGLTITRGRRTLEAVAAKDYEARLLNVEPGAPLISLHSVSYLADGTPLEYYHALHRGDRSQFEVELIRVRESNGLHLLASEQTDLPPSATLTPSAPESTG